jgi:hypothetical protein
MLDAGVDLREIQIAARHGTWHPLETDGRSAAIPG